MKLSVFLLPILFVLSFFSCTNNGAPQQDLQTKPTHALSYNWLSPADLGLSVKWARCNIGAMHLTDCGGYFAWGELVDKHSYTVQNYFDPTYLITQITPGQTDVAFKYWGPGWRMPTIEEFKELLNRDKCDISYDSQNRCIIIRGKKKVPSTKGRMDRDWIALPLTGYCYDKINGLKGDEGFYWTSTVYPGDSASAYSVNLALTHGGIFKLALPASRISGYAVRPVYDESLVTKD